MDDRNHYFSLVENAGQDAEQGRRLKAENWLIVYQRRLCNEVHEGTEYAVHWIKLARNVE